MVRARARTDMTLITHPQDTAEAAEAAEAARTMIPQGSVGVGAFGESRDTLENAEGMDGS